MNNYFFSSLKTHTQIYLIRIWQIVLIFISYFPIANINLNAIRPNILSIIIFYSVIFARKELLTKEYLLVLVILEYLLVGAPQGKIIFLIYLGAYYFIKKKKNIILNEGFLMIISYYFLFSFVIESLYTLSIFDLSKKLFFKDFIFILFNNLMFYILFHSIFMAYEFLLNKSRLKKILKLKG